MGFSPWNQKRREAPSLASVFPFMRNAGIAATAGTNPPAGPHHTHHGPAQQDDGRSHGLQAMEWRVGREMGFQPRRGMIGRRPLKRREAAQR